jgi:hypothetical protein
LANAGYPEATQQFFVLKEELYAGDRSRSANIEALQSTLQLVTSQRPEILKTKSAAPMHPENAHLSRSKV